MKFGWLSARCCQESGEVGDNGMAKTVNRMVIHHAGCLHERVADGRPYKAETSSFKVFTELFGLAGLGRYIA